MACFLPFSTFIPTFLRKLGLFAHRCAHCTRLSTVINNLKKIYEISVAQFDPFWRLFIHK